MTVMYNLALKLREGAALHQRGDLPGAESCFREVLDAEPEQIDALNFLGMVLALQKRYGEAVKAMQKAISVKPGDPLLLGNLGGLLNEANDPLTAIGYLREAIRLKPDHTDAIVSLAVALQPVLRKTPETPNLPSRNFALYESTIRRNFLPLSKSCSPTR
jgi:Flp pilus assembly protein TadD